MRHPTDGTLRRLVDEPAGVADADREHVAGCPACLSGLAAAQRGRGGSPARRCDVDARRRRGRGVAPPVARGRRRRPPAAAPARRARAAGGGRRCAARWSPRSASSSLLAGASAAAAADWLQIFRTEQIAPVAVTAGRPGRAARPLRLRRRSR